VEINSFTHFSNDNNLEPAFDNSTDEYDFSFLDNIREITGYLLIHDNTNLKKLSFKNLRLIRGKSLLLDRFSLYVENNIILDTLNLIHLKEIQRGYVFVQNNPNLCNMDEVNWLDMLPNKANNLIKIDKNANPSYCTKCTPTCCNSTSATCGCWYPNGCQKCNFF